jgi:hypothetical protein
LAELAQKARYMTNPWIIALRASGSDNRPWITRELRRNEFAGQRFREAGIIAYAELFEGYAEQNRLELEALDKMEQRVAELDAKLTGGAGERAA